MQSSGVDVGKLPYSTLELSLSSAIFSYLIARPISLLTTSPHTRTSVVLRLFWSLVWNLDHWSLILRGRARKINRTLHLRCEADSSKGLHPHFHLNFVPSVLVDNHNNRSHIGATPIFHSIVLSIVVPYIEERWKHDKRPTTLPRTTIEKDEKDTRVLTLWPWLLCLPCMSKRNWDDLPLLYCARVICSGDCVPLMVSEAVLTDYYHHLLSVDFHSTKRSPIRQRKRLRYGPFAQLYPRDCVLSVCPWNSSPSSAPPVDTAE